MSRRGRPPYGAWRSPLSAEMVAAGGLRISDIHVDEGEILWIEGRPADGGRCAVVRRTVDGRTVDVLPDAYSARSAVHEYGGGALAVADGTVFFTNQSDQRIHLTRSGLGPVPLTAPGPRRHADLTPIPGIPRILAVLETHGPTSVTNQIISVPTDGGAMTITVSGSDFYAHARPSPDGRRVAWLQWDQPAMPWDGCELWLADLDPQGMATAARRVAGGPEEAVLQPEWSPDGFLHFITDRTGWWNLHRWDDAAVVPVAPMEAECGRPMWVFGMSTYAFAGAEHIALCAARGGTWELLLVERTSGRVTPIPLPFTEMGHHVRAAAGRLVLDAGGPELPMSIVTVELGTGEHEIIRRSSDLVLGADIVSRFQRVEFPTTDSSTGHGLLYLPRSSPDEGHGAERPPLLVRAHGGPTSAAGTALDPVVQYWTTRGFAVLDVNYRGSTGYGRAYRQHLRGGWGIVDVQDCVDAAGYLVALREVDGSRLLITGASAGGYVVLSALTFHDDFAAGASHYGIGDTEALAEETHKFEARYLDGLIGPYPDCREEYRMRSPVNFIERVRAPTILFQGTEDAIVPLRQAEDMFSALRSNGVPCALLLFEGEQHGFRRQATIRRVLESELYFFCRALDIEPADRLEAVPIENAGRPGGPSRRDDP
ncbi:MAG: prolyl oligopeptidase family serine peptidase [Candidatus Dormibacteria bacterium]